MPRDASDADAEPDGDSAADERRGGGRVAGSEFEGREENGQVREQERGPRRRSALDDRRQDAGDARDSRRRYDAAHRTAAADGDVRVVR